MTAENPYTLNPLEPYVELSPARWFRVESPDHGEMAQIREVIEVHRDPSDLEGPGVEYRGYGQKILKNGRPSEHKRLQYVYLNPATLSPAIKAELARRRGLLAARYGRKSA